VCCLTSTDDILGRRSDRCSPQGVLLMAMVLAREFSIFMSVRV
jgi:hypothetical protein